jgi:hypothetical protein
MKVRTEIPKGMEPAINLLMGARKTVAFMTACGHRHVVTLLKTVMQNVLCLNIQ